MIEIEELNKILNEIYCLSALTKDDILDFCNKFMSEYLNYNGEESLFFSEGYRDGFSHAITLLTLIMNDVLGYEFNSTDEVMTKLLQPLFKKIKETQNA